MDNDITLPNNIRYMLLLILEKDGNIEELKNIGYSYEKISEIINNEIKVGTILLENNRFQITQKGIILKNELIASLNYSNLETLVSPQISNIITEKKDDSFFIPSQNDLPD
jgi:hypothetical protein